MKKPLRLVIDPQTLPEPKNVNGILGEKCIKCGGYGYTLSLNSKRLACMECEETGVKLPTRRELQTQISEIKKDLHKLRKAIMAAINMGEMPDNTERGEIL